MSRYTRAKRAIYVSKDMHLSFIIVSASTYFVSN